MKDIRVGDKVRVHSGASIETDHPSKKPRYKSKRANTVTVEIVSVMCEYVAWFGSGSYLFTTDMLNVDFISRKVET